MTIELKIEKVPDVLQDTRWPLFDITKVNALESLPPQIGLIDVICEEKELPRDMDVLLQVCSERIKPLLFHNVRMAGSKCYLFMAQTFWQQKTRVLMCYKLKRILPEWARTDIVFEREAVFESSDGVRFAGIAEIREATFDIALQLIREKEAALIITDSVSESKLEGLFHSAFPVRGRAAETSIDWVTLSLSQCPEGDILIRAKGTFDERLVSVNLIMSHEKLAFLGA